LERLKFLLSLKKLFFPYDFIDEANSLFFKLLSSIFGRTYGLNKRKTLKRSFEQSSDDQQDQANLKNIAQNSLQLLNKRQKVTETRKFAGQSITCVKFANNIIRFIESIFHT